MFSYLGILTNGAILGLSISTWYKSERSFLGVLVCLKTFCNAEKNDCCLPLLNNAIVKERRTFNFDNLTFAYTENRPKTKKTTFHSVPQKKHLYVHHNLAALSKRILYLKQPNRFRLVSDDGIINEDAFYNYLTVWYTNDPLAYAASQASIVPTPKTFPDSRNGLNMIIPPSTGIKYTQMPFYLNGKVMQKAETEGFVNA